MNSDKNYFIVILFTVNRIITINYILTMISILRMYKVKLCVQITKSFSTN